MSSEGRIRIQSFRRGESSVKYFGFSPLDLQVLILAESPLLQGGALSAMLDLFQELNIVKIALADQLGKQLRRLDNHGCESALSRYGSKPREKGRIWENNSTRIVVNPTPIKHPDPRPCPKHKHGSCPKNLLWARRVRFHDIKKNMLIRKIFFN